MIKEGVTMSDMGTHEQTAAPRDHLWVAVIIATCVLLEVWASWLGIGSVSGFPKLGRVTTGWILPVATEAYWSYALWAWLAGAPGPRSKRFAMWTAGGMFVLSLLGQESGHLLAASHEALPPAYVVAFVTALPLISLALVAVLVHLRQADREEVAALARAAERAAREAADLRAEADERAALRGELEAQREAHAAVVRAMEEDLAIASADRETAEQEAARLATADAEREDAVTAKEAAEAAREAAETARTEAEQQAAKAAAEAARLARKLGAPAGSKSARGGAAAATPAARTQLEIARKARTDADEILAKEPDISGAQLAERVGMSERWGQEHRKQFFKRSLGETG
jgi:hypothetical protein